MTERRNGTLWRPALSEPELVPEPDVTPIRGRAGLECRSTRKRPTALFLAPTAYVLSGLATWLDYLLPGLEEHGWRAFAGLCSGTWHDHDAYRKIHRTGETVRIENPTGSREGRVREIRRAIERVGADLAVSVNIPDTFTAVARLRSAGSAATRAVMALHSVDAWSLDDVQRWSPLLDGVISTNRLPCRLVERTRAGRRPPAFHAPCGVSIPPKREAAEGRMDCVRIAYVGRLEQNQKRVHDLPAVAEALDRRGVRWELVVAGSGEEERLLRDELDRPWRTGQVRFAGFLEPGSLPAEVYTRSDVLLVTSEWETGPIVAWEAMAYGVAVVSSRYVGSVSEGSLVDGENCLLFPIGKMDAAADCILRSTGKDLREKLVEGGRRLVEQRYSQAASVRRWDEALRAILEEPPGESVPEDLLHVPAAGRLDRCFGTRAGETVRRLCRLRFRHPGPGAEWPHSYSKTTDDETFMRWAAAIDAQETQT